MMQQLSGHDPAGLLPWSGQDEENRRFNRFLFACLFPALLAGAIVPQLPVHQQQPTALPEQPLRRVKLHFEPEPPPPEIIEPAPIPAPDITPTPAAQPAPAATSAAQSAQAQAPVKKNVDKTAELKKNLQNLRDNAAVLASLSQRPLKQSVTSSQARNERLSAELDQGANDPGPASPQRAQGDIDLSGHASTRVATPASSSGSGSSQKTGRTGGGGSGRSSQEIQSVFDRNKAAINAIYERALRNQPELAGKLVLRLSILPSGEVSDCSIVSDSLGDTTVTARIVRRVKLLNFGAKQTPKVTVDYPIEFFPG